jgi:pyridoxal 5'-phosphate synthase pdxT subunit
VKKIGVLALQGDFAEHISMFNKSGTEALPVRLPEQLEGIDGLLIPGGESTTIGKLMQHYSLMQPIKDLARLGFPLMGTCAGMILLSSEATDLPFAPLGAIDITVQRNAFGRQVDSFEVDLTITDLGKKPLHAVFIRAPFISSVRPGVEIMARLADGTVVAARQGKVLVAAFHPELTADIRLHRYFVEKMVNGSSSR